MYQNIFTGNEESNLYENGTSVFIFIRHNNSLFFFFFVQHALDI